MKDLALTVKPIVGRFCRKSLRFVKKKCKWVENIQNSLPEFSDKTLPLTKDFWNRIVKIISSKENIKERIDEMMVLFKECIKNVDLSKDENQTLVFEQLEEFLNYFWFFLRKNSRYLTNTLSPYSIEKFNENTIWGKVDRIITKDNFLDDPEYSLSCWNFALLFKDFFDQLQDLWLKITNYFFMEYTGWNHLWLVVVFQWKHYLVDFSIDEKFVFQSIDDLSGSIFERMKWLKNDDGGVWVDNIINYKENKSNENMYYKVCFQTIEELFELITSITNEEWHINIEKKDSILDVLLPIDFNINSERIIFSQKFWYYFDKKFDEESLSNISDKDLLKEMVNNISYKKEKGKNTIIKVFDFEKKHLLSRLSYFANRIDYSRLRKILAGSQTKSDE